MKTKEAFLSFLACGQFPHPPLNKAGIHTLNFLSLSKSKWLSFCQHLWMYCLVLPINMGYKYSMVQNVQLQFVYTTSSKFMASTVASTAEGSSLNLELQTKVASRLSKTWVVWCSENPSINCKFVIVLTSPFSSTMICFYILFHVAINMG